MGRAWWFGWRGMLVVALVLLVGEVGRAYLAPTSCTLNNGSNESPPLPAPPPAPSGYRWHEDWRISKPYRCDGLRGLLPFGQERRSVCLVPQDWWWRDSEPQVVGRDRAGRITSYALVVPSEALEAARRDQPKLDWAQSDMTGLRGPSGIPVKLTCGYLPGLV